MKKLLLLSMLLVPVAALACPPVYFNGEIKTETIKVYKPTQNVAAPMKLLFSLQIEAGCPPEELELAVVPYGKNSYIKESAVAIIPFDSLKRLAFEPWQENTKLFYGFYELAGEDAKALFGKLSAGEYNLVFFDKTTGTQGVWSFHFSNYFTVVNLSSDPGNATTALNNADADKEDGVLTAVYDISGRKLTEAEILSTEAAKKGVVQVELYKKPNGQYYSKKVMK